MSIAAALSLALCGFQGSLSSAGDEAVAYATSVRLEERLGASLSASWVNVDLRTLLLRIGRERQVALILDRRIDPSRLQSFEARQQPLREALDELAERLDAGLSFAGNAVVLAPPDSAARLRTLIQLRTDEIPDGVKPGAKPQAAKLRNRRLALNERRTIRWADLDEPRGLVEQIAGRWALTVDGLDLVPHDLWAVGTIPEATAAEALSMVLNQFDLTFEWTAHADGIRIVPLSGEVAIERKYVPRGMTVAEAVRTWPDDFPGVKAEAAGREVRVRGRIEDHDALQASLKPGGAMPRTSKKPSKTGPTPLARRTFTLRTQDAPAAAILEKLKESGLKIEWDAAALKAAGVDLTKRIALDLKDATADQLFDAICKPLGIEFTIAGEKITLRTKAP